MDAPNRRFLERQPREIQTLLDESDLVDIVPVGCEPYQLYLVRLATRGLVRMDTGEIATVEGCAFRIWLPEDYTRHVSPFETIQWVGPTNIHHPNAGKGPGGATYICLGRITPGTPVVDLVEQVHEIFGYVNRLPAEDKAISRDACQWARANLHRLPVDDRPLRRSSFSSSSLDDLVVEEVSS